MRGTPSSVNDQMKTMVPPAKKSRSDQRKGDLEESTEALAAEILSRLFHGRINIGQ